MKVNRANVHIKALYRSIEASARYPKATFQRHGELHISSKLPNVLVEPVEIYRLTVSASALESWGQIFGDAIGNLRQALDHIAWALAVEQAKPSVLSERDSRSIQFPIVADRAEFEDKGRSAQRTRPYIDPVAWSVISDYQPHPDNRRNRPDLWTLGAINELGNRDKHRLVTPTLNAAIVRFPFYTEETETVLYFNDRTSLDLLITPRVRPKVGNTLEPEVAFDVVVSSNFRPASGTFGTSISISILTEIHRFVRDEVIPSFACFFPK